MIKVKEGKVLMEGDLSVLSTDLMCAVNGVYQAAVNDFDVPEPIAVNVICKLFEIAMTELAPDNSSHTMVDLTNLSDILDRIKEEDL